MNSINLSFFDIFKIGPGPSSSHTIGPMNAARNFVLNCEKLPESTLRIVASVKVKLFGSLSSTGIGHGTDRAIVAGLLGYHPESCSPDILEELLQLQTDIVSGWGSIQSFFMMGISFLIK